MTKANGHTWSAIWWTCLDCGEERAIGDAKRTRSALLQGPPNCTSCHSMQALGEHDGDPCEACGHIEHRSNLEADRGA